MLTVAALLGAAAITPAPAVPVEGSTCEIFPADNVWHLNVSKLPVSPRSDKDGRFYFDLPVANVDYDFHFIKAGYQQLDVRIHPNGPSTFNYVLRRG